MKQTFNVTPTIGWSIDPFGSSGRHRTWRRSIGGQWTGRRPRLTRFPLSFHPLLASNAALYAMMGFDALVINRIPDEEMDVAKANKSKSNHK